ncbi:Hypothetical protein I595_2249 [Croceitalea dokdonensis DOKDO 023]|uniref:Uncharacterized protein n=1 Tax=Croceitalea dokdonensis DOKDO 023 TaxID=1300341 RepID=A0A0P7AV24_9FLAO|nr:Hypothetical protein I595_2249 [Croceitalea dokdonensis DOKDO 023]
MLLHQHVYILRNVKKYIGSRKVWYKMNQGQGQFKKSKKIEKNWLSRA